MNVKENVYAVRKILKNSFIKYRKDDPIRLAGTTAYFTIFAIAPILIIIISVLGVVFEEQTISNKIYNELNILVGNQGTDFIKSIIQNFRKTERDLIGTIIGVVIFLIASTTFFNVLQNSLNFIWRVRAKPKNNFFKTLKDRVLSFGMILSMGFILLVSLVIDAALSFLKDFLNNYIENYTFLFIRSINFILSFGILTFIFALIYKFLPDTKIKWRVTWVGAIITAVLFTIGKYLIGLVLGASNINVMYGAAGSVVAFVLWVFYSSIILFYGAEITQQYAEYYNFDIKPKSYAVQIEINEVKGKEV
jgi:membrane protein